MYNQGHTIDWDQIDALLVPGGEDIDPKYYKFKVEAPLRDEIQRLDHLVEYTKKGKILDPFEYKLWQQYFTSVQTKNLPALGICRGMQMLAVSQGVPLLIDINAQLKIPNRRNLLDEIFITKKDTKAFSIFKFKNFGVKKTTIKTLWPITFYAIKKRWPHLKCHGFFSLQSNS